MTNLLPGVALWRSGYRAWGVFFQAVCASAAVASLILFFDLLNARPDVGQGVYLRPGAISVHGALWHVVWLSWGISLWSADRAIFRTIPRRWQMFLIGLLCPGYSEKLVGNRAAGENLFRWWVALAGFLSITMYLFTLDAAPPFGDGSLAGFVKLGVYLSVLLWPILSILILLRTVFSAVQGASKHTETSDG